ncbi:hypothetical protein [Chryseobacterium oncorhynchi]|uniref:Uncharacterized protein n=1 Tax=Chryseobacterium oncorhynchi TaxID=741074 RepID=A0A316WSC3_9FLAO|nr:hypothetical protein [Chryseobacterium oncorhynchi]PWN64341.1 hypothetical protein C1638_010545 [Chryseobacterium oncorhynchi]
METNIQHQESLQYAEVYISDMLALKDIFLQTLNLKKVNHDFGIPFLLVKKENKIASFASLIINENGEIGFKIYDKKEIKESEKKNFMIRAENYFRRSNTPNFRDPKQLKSSINGMISWLNP